MIVDLASPNEYSDVSTKGSGPLAKGIFPMRTISIKEDIEEVLLQYARAIPEVFTSYDITYVEIQLSPEDTNVWDIVFVESFESEVLLGEITLHGDFDATFEIFED